MTSEINFYLPPGFSIEVDGETYDIVSHRDDSEKGLVKYTFTTTINEKEYDLKVNVTSDTYQGLQAIMSLDPDYELANIMVTEMKLEISKLLGGAHWEEYIKKATLV